MIKYSIGIDISKKDIHCCISVIDDKQRVKVIRSHTYTNSKSGFLAFDKWVKETCTNKEIPMVLAMEATGVYYENCALFAFTQGYDVSVVLPNKAKKYISAVGIKTKNDKTDAKALSRMGAEQSLELWQPMGTFFYTLRSLTRHYQALKENQTSFSNQLEANSLGMYKNSEVEESLNIMLEQTATQVKVIVDAISNHIATNTEVADKVKNITAIKGVGELTVAVLLAETNGFELFKNIGQLISYAGYDVVENQSGLHVGKTKISKKGNSRIRRALHMPALNMVTYDVKIFKDLFNRTLKTHNIKMKSYVAVQKKLLSIIYTLWKKNQKFDENYTTRDVEVEHSSRHRLEEAA